MNIQDKMQEIHHKFGVTEKANYEIQLFVDDLIKKDRAEQLTLTEQLVCDDNELDCPYEFTSRCTMGRCGCKPKAN